MISNIRDAIHKAGYRYVMWGILIIFAFSSIGVGMFTRQGSSAGVVARVGGYEITQQELRSKAYMFEQRIKDLKQQFGDYASYFLQSLGLTDNPIDMAFNELVREKLLLGATDALSLRSLSPEYVAEKLHQPAFAMHHLGMLVPPFLYDARGTFDQRALHNYLKHQGMSFQIFEEALEAALKQYFIMSLMPSSVYVSATDSKTAASLENARRSFKVIDLDLDDYVAELQAQGKGKDEQDLQHYFDSHNNINKRYWSAERRSGTVWKFPVDAYGIALTDAEIKAAYENNKHRWPGKTFEAVKKDVEKALLKEKFTARFTGDARRAIAQGGADTIAQFAQKHGAKKSLVSNEEFRPDVLAVNKLFSVKNVGKAATATDDAGGYIVVLDALKERTLRPFSDVRADVERDFYQEKAAQVLGAEVHALLKSGTAAAFNEFAKKKSITARAIAVAGTGKKAWESAEKDGLPVSRMRAMMHPGYTISSPSNSGVLLVMLESFDPSSDTMSDEQQSALNKRLKTQAGQILPAAFIASLQNSATIDYKDIIKQRQN